MDWIKENMQITIRNLTNRVQKYRGPSGTIYTLEPEKYNWIIDFETTPLITILDISLVNIIDIKDVNLPPIDPNVYYLVPFAVKDRYKDRLDFVLPLGYDKESECFTEFGI